MTGPPDPTGTDEATTEDDDHEDGRIGPFSSWRALYVAVLVYTAALIALLYLLTHALDHTVG